VFSAAGGGTELLQCTVCNRLFTTVHRYSGHACEEEVVSTELGRGCALAVERAPYSAPAHRCVGCGRERRDCDRCAAWLGTDCGTGQEIATAVRLITQWFEEGAAGGGKTKCSAATALQRLRALREPGGTLVYVDEDALPSEARIKQFFGTLSQKRRAAVHAGV
jgi:hypothetical protein